MILSTLVGLCCCMDGFLNSSGFEAMDEEFGLDFLASGPYMVNPMAFASKILKILL